MSYTSGFFDAIDQGDGDYDRVYSAATFAHYFSLLVKNGVFPDPSTGLQVRASSSPNMQVSVSPGSGWINGYYITVPDNSPEVLTVPTANPSLSRYDSVIMGLNFVDREIQLYIKSGSVSASPSPVTLQRDNDLYELELARISVGAGAASITQSLIIDTRSDSTRCGIVAGMIDQIDTTDLFAQYDYAFQTWFEDIQSQLSGDVATNLQNQINALKTDKVNVSDKATEAEATAATNDSKWMTPKMVGKAIDSQVFSVGDIKMSGKNLELSYPDKFMSCDGRALSRASYADLYGEIAERFGVPVSAVQRRLDDTSAAATYRETTALRMYAVSDSGEVTIAIYNSSRYYLIIARFDSSGNLIGYYNRRTTYHTPYALFYIGETCYLLTNRGSDYGTSFLYTVEDTTLTEIWTASSMYNIQMIGITKIGSSAYFAIRYTTSSSSSSTTNNVVSVFSVTGVSVGKTDVLTGVAPVTAYLLGRTLYIGKSSTTTYNSYTDVVSISLPLQSITDSTLLGFFSHLTTSVFPTVYAGDGSAIGLLSDTTVYILTENSSGDIEEKVYSIVNKSGVSVSSYWLELDEEGLPVVLGLYKATSSPYIAHLLLSTRFESTLQFLKEGTITLPASTSTIAVPSYRTVAAHKFFCMEKEKDTDTSTSSYDYYWLSIVEAIKDDSSFCIPEDDGSMVGPITTFIKVK